jgi:hypothetical protein
MRLVAAFACAVMLTPSVALAQLQPGSTGGTIGKTGKSSSGGEEQTEISRPTQRSAAPASRDATDRQKLPGTIRFSEQGALGNYSATLRHVGGNEYEAAWNVAVASRMTVRMTKDSMTVQRRDTSNAAGLASGTYSGTRTGDSASGSFSIGINHGTWNASW